MLEHTEGKLGCDPSLLVAIMVADTGLGVKNKTNYNPMNVGNNDRGDRVHFTGWQEGVNAGCETLNNKYLGSLTMLGELSGGGRVALGIQGCAGNKCYASSMGNWHVNVSAILSELKGKSIGASYLFRRT